MNQKTLCIFLLMLVQVRYTSAQVIISSIDSLLLYVEVEGITLKNATLRVEQAKRERLAAALGILDLNGSASLSYTNNLRLPVYLFPAEVFGGQPGTFQQIRSGLQYTTNANLYAEMKLLNPSGWTANRLSNSHLQSSKIERSITKRQLYQDIGSLYYNIVNLSAESESNRDNTVIADTLYRIASRKFNLGLINMQQVKQAEANLLQARESSYQTSYLLQQQYLALKILCDLPEQDSILIRDNSFVVPDSAIALEDALALSRSMNEYENVTLKFQQSRRNFWPTLAFFMSYTNQQFSDESTLNLNSTDWIPSSYIGLKINIPIPSTMSLSRLSKTKFDHKISLNNIRSAQLEARNNASRLNSVYQQKLSKYKSDIRLNGLRQEIYQKNILNYLEGISDITPVLESFERLIASQYNLNSAKAELMMAIFNIELNNEIR